MVEVNWASGRVVRDYTFLLDPPGVDERRRRSSRWRRSARRRRRAAVAAAPTSGGRARSAAPRQGEHLYRQARRYAVEDRQGVQARERQPRPDAGRAVPQQRGRVRRQEHEPPAHRRRSSRIPPADEAAATTPTEATKVVHVQAADWRAYRDRVAAAAPTTRGRRVASPRPARSAPRSRTRRQAAQPGKDQLRVSREAGKGAGLARRRPRRSPRKDKALSRSEFAHRRAREDAEGHAAGGRAQDGIKSQTMADLQKQAEATAGSRRRPKRRRPNRRQIATRPQPQPPAANRPCRRPRHRHGGDADTGRGAAGNATTARDAPRAERDARRKPHAPEADRARAKAPEAETAAPAVRRPPRRPRPRPRSSTISSATRRRGRSAPARSVIARPASPA